MFQYIGCPVYQDANTPQPCLCWSGGVAVPAPTGLLRGPPGVRAWPWQRVAQLGACDCNLLRERSSLLITNHEPLRNPPNRPVARRPSTWNPTLHRRLPLTPSNHTINIIRDGRPPGSLVVSGNAQDPLQHCWRRQRPAGHPRQRETVCHSVAGPPSLIGLIRSNSRDTTRLSPSLSPMEPSGPARSWRLEVPPPPLPPRILVC